MGDINVFQELWKLVERFLSVIQIVWDFLFDVLVIRIEWLKIPIIAPDGININTGITPIAIFGVGITFFILMWLIKALVPFL